MTNHKRHRESRTRNAEAATIPDDILLTPAPLLLPQATQPSLPYAETIRPRPGRVGRAASAVRRRVGAMTSAVATAIKPQTAVINRDHVLGLGANAAGGILTALVAHELVDNVGVMPMAIGATILGGLGSTLLGGHWQRAAQGMFGAGVGQLGTGYLAERALRKAEKVQKTAAASPPPANDNAGKRNAASPGVTEEDLIRAMERSERRLDAMLAEDGARNGYGYAPGYGADLDPAYWAV